MLFFLANYAKRDTVSRRRRDANQPKKIMELLIAADYTMVNHYAKEFLPTYLLTVANIVSETILANAAKTVESTLKFNQQREQYYFVTIGKSLLWASF